MQRALDIHIDYRIACALYFYPDITTNLNLAVPRRTQRAVLFPSSSQWHVKALAWARGVRIKYAYGAGAIKPRTVDVLPPIDLLMAMR